MLRRGHEGRDDSRRGFGHAVLYGFWIASVLVSRLYMIHDRVNHSTILSDPQTLFFAIISGSPYYSELVSPLSFQADYTLQHAVMLASSQPWRIQWWTRRTDLLRG